MIRTSHSPPWVRLLAVAALSLGLAGRADAGAMVAGYNSSTLARNDDLSTGLVGMGFSANFYGTTYANLYVNNNGNVTFNAPLGTFTPFGLTTTTIPIIAPFFADVDTRNLLSAETKYGTGTVLAGTIVGAGTNRAAFGVTWDGVGYFPSAADKLNKFQMLLVDRSDIAAGDFDIVFNYDQIQWETGGASGGSGGLGGNSARVGYSNGGTEDFELTGSGVNGAFIDGGANALISNRLNSTQDGRYIFRVRDGNVLPPTEAVPEPASVALLTVGAAGFFGYGWRRRKAAPVAG